jgi:hypothetical protein
LKDLERKTQAETGMTPQQQQMFMQQMMQGGGSMMGGMGGGMMQPGMVPQGRMPMVQPGMAPAGSGPRQPGEMTPQEEQEFLKKIEKLQQQQSTTPAPNK